MKRREALGAMTGAIGATVAGLGTAGSVAKGVAAPLPAQEQCEFVGALPPGECHWNREFFWISKDESDRGWGEIVFRVEDFEAISKHSSGGWLVQLRSGANCYITNKCGLRLLDRLDITRPAE